MIIEDLNFKVPDRLFAPAESLHVSGVIAQESIELGPDTYVLDGPISWQADITNTGNALLVSGDASMRAGVACARCLEECIYDVQGQIEGYYLVRSEEGEGFEEDEEDEFDVLPEDHTLDFEGLIFGAIALELPLMPLCGEDCLGLCPTCGANLNEGECGCSDEAPIDPTNPFAALAGLTFD